MIGWPHPSKDCKIVRPIMNMAKTRSCMSRLTRILTAVAFIVHMLLGCCAHHVHAGQGKDCQPSTQGTPASDAQTPDSHESGPEHSHHASHDCQGAKCTFVPSSPKSGNLPVQPFSQWFATPLVQDLSSPAGIADRQHCFAAGGLLLPIRLHLANQVLLV